MIEFEDGDEFLPPEEPSIEDLASEGSLLRLLQKQRNVVARTLELVRKGRATDAELREQLSRMQADGERAIAAHRDRQPEPGFAPSGNAREAMELYRSYDVTTGAPNGGVVLRGVSAERLAKGSPEDAAAQGANVIRLPNGRTIVESRAGYLTDPRPQTAEQARIAQSYSNYGLTLRLAQTLAKRKNQSTLAWDIIAENPTVRRAFFTLNRAIRSAGEPAGLAVKAMFERAMSGGTATGDEWVAQPYLQGNWVGPSDLMPQLADRFPQMDAPQAEFTAASMPAGELIARQRNRLSSNQPSAYPVVDQATGKRSIAISSLVMRLLLDDEWLEDFIRSNMVRMEDLAGRLRRGMRRTVEAAVIHGHTAGTQDALATWPMGSMVSAGAYDGSDSPFKCWNGLRRLAFADTGAANDAAGTFSGTTAMAMIARMGTRAMSPDAAWLCNINLLYKKLMPADDFRLWSSVGEMATARSGAMGQMLGRDVILSEFMPGDLNASGVFDNVTKTKTALLLFDPQAYEIWNLLEESVLDVATAEEGAMHLIAKRRLAFVQASVTDNGHGSVMDYNFAA